MDLDAVDVELGTSCKKNDSFCGSACGANVIARQASRGSAFDRLDTGKSCVASRVELTVAKGRGGSDRAGRSPGCGPIGELDSSGGDELRTEHPAVPKAAPATESHGNLDTVDYERGDCSREVRHRHVDLQPGRVAEPAMPAALVDRSCFDVHPYLCFSDMTSAPLHLVGVDTDPEVELRELIGNMTRDAKLEIEEANTDILSVIRALGGNETKYKRERRSAMRAIVSEVYSAPRVTAAIKQVPGLKLIPGFALDLSTVDEHGVPWDFDCPRQQEKALQKQRDEKPAVLIGSPMCTAFSTWQYVNNTLRDESIVKKEKERAIMHLTFCVRLYREQLAAGRYFIHEHPAHATSWQTEVMKSLMSEVGVEMATCDQCQYGMASPSGDPMKKPTSFLTNSLHVAAQLRRRCTGRGGACSRDGGGRHVHCRGKLARLAAVYHFRLCRAMFVGIRKQLDADGSRKDGYVGSIGAVWEDDRVTRPGLFELRCRGGHILKLDASSGEVFRDDLTGQLLDPELVKQARQKELAYFEDKGVWSKRSKSECHRVTGRGAISVRWVDTNKGDDVSPNIRSRLVARQIRGPGEEPIFAPTPPLETLRTVISLAATDLPGRDPCCRDSESDDRMQISAVDISRAYFNASTEGGPATYVQLPAEDPDSARGMCGFLLKHMYGTQAAADGWQQEYAGFMRELGFQQGAASPCIFVHTERNLATSVHGDDFTTCGPKRHLDWFEDSLEAKYELKKGGRLGPGRGDCKELTVLNRVLRWCDDGIEYEADPRQGERLLEGLGLDSGCNGAATPGIKILPQQIESEEKMAAAEQTEFRALAARSNYLSADRIELQFASKECCRHMSNPGTIAQSALKRLGRFLLKHQRLVYRYRWQTADTIDTYSDTDWGGCQLTRKSTSGGAVMLGEHTIRTYSSTQASVSLSSGEAEYYGLVKAAAAGLGQQAILKDFGLHVPVRLWSDSSATLGISKRSGLGKLRHLDTQTLWLQEKVRTGSLEVRKVRGEVNPADLFTKHLPSHENILQLVRLFGCEHRDGRPASAPLLRPHKQADQSINLVGELRSPNSLPHLCSAEDMDRLYPRVEVFPGNWLDVDDDFVETDRCLLPHHAPPSTPVMQAHKAVNHPAAAANAAAAGVLRK